MPHWPGKLLLLGEYTVLLGGEALAVPLRTRRGTWTNHNEPPDSSLHAWACWLESQEQAGALPWGIDSKGFKDFVLAGGRFLSDIPPGCGLGSSGALVAGLARRWSVHLPIDPVILQTGLAHLESFFHGNSSGLDPLVSLLDRPVHLDRHGQPQPLDDLELPKGLFLYDSRLSRHTAPLVASFKQRLTDQLYRCDLESGLMLPLSQAIEALLARNFPAFSRAFAQISKIQQGLFGEMIPESVQTVWTGPAHQLKLCGAGGGGYFLGLASDPSLLDLDPDRLLWL